MSTLGHGNNTFQTEKKSSDINPQNQNISLPVDFQGQFGNKEILAALQQGGPPSPLGAMISDEMILSDDGIPKVFSPCFVNNRPSNK